jgi:lanosterol synthase
MPVPFDSKILTHFHLLFSKAMNWLVVYYHYGKDSYQFKQHVKRNADFMWMGAEGMMMNGTNGSQLWDAAFIAQACVEAKLADNAQYRDNMINTLKFIELTQVILAVMCFVFLANIIIDPS